MIFFDIRTAVTWESADEVKFLFSVCSASLCRHKLYIACGDFTFGKAADSLTP